MLEILKKTIKMSCSSGGGGKTTVEHAVKVLATVMEEEHRYNAQPGYGEHVQKHASMPMWRLQLITWLMEVS